METTTTKYRACKDCGVEAETRTCDDCGKSAAVIDCGHNAQPAEIAAGRCDGTDMGRTYCSACASGHDTVSVDESKALAAKVKEFQDFLIDSMHDGLHLDFKDPLKFIKAALEAFTSMQD